MQSECQKLASLYDKADQVFLFQEKKTHIENVNVDCSLTFSIFIFQIARRRSTALQSIVSQSKAQLMI